MKVNSNPSISILADDDKTVRFTGGVPQTDTVHGEHQSGAAVVAPAATQALSLGSVAAVAGVWLEATAAITLTLNGTPLSLLPPAAGAVARFFMEGTVTSLSVTNSGSANAKVTYAVWGDPA